jgi:hypothetical protein
MQNTSQKSQTKRQRGKTGSVQLMVLDDAVKKIIPKGTWNSKTGLTAREHFAKHVEKNVKAIFNAYFDLGVNKGEVRALDTLLGYAWGRPNQSVEMNHNVKVSLSELAREALLYKQTRDGSYKEIETTNVPASESETP